MKAIVSSYHRLGHLAGLFILWALPTGSVVCAANLPCASEPVGLVAQLRWNPGYPGELSLVGDHVYLADNGGALRIVDVTYPCTPTETSTTWMQPTGQELWGIHVHGPVAFLANDWNGLQLYNVSDPFHPVHLGTRKDGTYAQSVYFDGMRYAYVGYSYSAGSELVIYDMTNFPALAPVGRYDAAGWRHGGNVTFDAGRSRVYLRARNGGDWFEIVDVSNPSAPTRVSALSVSGLGGLGQIRIQANYALVATSAEAGVPGGLLVIDIGNENAPFVAAFAALPDAGSPDVAGSGLDVVGDRAYLVASNGLYVLDVSVPTSPTILNHFGYPSEFLPSRGGRVAVREHLAYVTSFPDWRSGNTRGGLAVFKLYDPVVHVEIDIKPGSDDNPINPRSNGVIAVAILTTDDFDASTVDPTGVTFGPLGAAAVRQRGHREDVDGDGDDDLVLHFRTRDTGIRCGETSALLTAETFEGQLIEGIDAIKTIGCR